MSWPPSIGDQRSTRTVSSILLPHVQGANEGATNGRVQLTANGGFGFVEAVMQNVGDELVDVPAGQLRVMVVKVA